jgi:rfaE bifunctional protein kinase chain/domain
MKRIEDLKILVVGDIMLDKYVMGEVERISPEAPVPIVHVHDEYSTLGGCGNVVRNIVEIGAKVTCVASVGDDENGRIVLGKLAKLGVDACLVRESRCTIVKERIIADERKIQMLRVDREVVKPIDPEKIIPELYNDDFNFDIVVVSDYGKGVITNKLMKHLNNDDTKLIVDPKPVNKKIYGFPYMITPNRKELKQMGGANELLADGAKYVLETKGRDGMTLYDEIEAWNIDAEPVEIYNVSGAGDTVVAVMAVCLSMGYGPVESATIANKCAGYVVTQPGTCVIPKNIFMENLGDYYMEE